jgi:hypothetical protein
MMHGKTMTPRPLRPFVLAPLLALAFGAPARAQGVDAATGMPAAAEATMEVEAETGLPPPVPVADGRAPVRLADTVDVPRIGRRIARFAFPPGTEAPVLGSQDGAAYRMLRELHAAGEAAGNLGDLYDNRDDGHSRLPAADHPQLAHVTYDAAARAEDLHYGLGDRMLFDAPVLGNSSTALTGGAWWRSQPRLALTGGDGSGPYRLFQNYAAGQIYVYPEHRDHDPEFGDLIPANTPYMLISQGSSGSDRPHMEAVAMILAAFRPDTKAFLAESGLLASTVQMVFRRSQTTVLSRAAYLSGLAHPSVFDRKVINLARMVALANAVRPDDVPPMVQLRVVGEHLPAQGAEMFGDGLDERFFDTPSAIARIWRSAACSRSMTVSAEATEDPAGRPLEFIWTVLRGDPERTRIEVDGTGATARITVDWQDPRPVPGLPDIVSNRVDIGVFASNGVHDSAPAFVSVLLPRHETRTCEAGPDGAPRPVSIDHAPGPDVYADPALFPLIGWRDDYAYGPDGALLGWTRTRDGSADDYAADGARVLTRGPDGRPAHVEIVDYAVVPGAEDGPAMIEERSTGVFEKR